MLRENIIIPLYNHHPIGNNVFLVSGLPFVYLSDIKSLIFGDIHFGQESALGLLDKSDQSSSSILAEHLLNGISKIVTKVEVSKIIINGDIKHETYSTNGQEISSLNYFLNDPRIQSYEIVLIRGNHDKLLNLAIRQVKHSKLSVVNSLCIPPYCIFHGHENYLLNDCGYVILSHEHPAYTFRGNNFEKIKTNAFVLIRSKSNQQILILPAANLISTGVAYPIQDNRNFLSPFLKKDADLSFQHIFPFSPETGILLLPPHIQQNK